MNMTKMRRLPFFPPYNGRIYFLSRLNLFLYVCGNCTLNPRLNPQSHKIKERPCWRGRQLLVARLLLPISTRNLASCWKASSSSTIVRTCCVYPNYHPANSNHAATEASLALMMHHSDKIVGKKWQGGGVVLSIVSVNFWGSSLVRGPTTSRGGISPTAKNTVVVGEGWNLGTDHMRRNQFNS